jgi:hypothetical protein
MLLVLLVIGEPSGYVDLCSIVKPAYKDYLFS